MRKKIVAGNWKMNNDGAQTAALVSDLKNQIKTLANYVRSSRQQEGHAIQPSLQQRSSISSLSAHV